MKQKKKDAKKFDDLFVVRLHQKNHLILKLVILKVNKIFFFTIQYLKKQYICYIKVMHIMVNIH